MKLECYDVRLYVAVVDHRVGVDVFHVQHRSQPAQLLTGQTLMLTVKVTVNVNVNLLADVNVNN